MAGCTTLAPHYERPSATVSPTWPQGAAYAPSQPAATAAADLKWRDVFLDPKLQAVIDLALKNNQDLRVAVLNVQSSRGQYQTQRAALLPAASLDASLTREHAPSSAFGFGGPGGGSVDIRYYGLTAGVTNYELDLFGRVRSLTRQALEQYLATDEARKAAQISLISEVATDYLTLAADRQRLTVAQQTLASQRGSLELTQARFKAGTASQLDVSQAQTTVDQARADIASYTTQVAQDLNALNLVVGTQTPDDLTPAGLGDSSPVLTSLPVGVSSEVLLRRPDVLEAEHTLRGYNANIGAARAAFFPRLTLTGTGGSENTGLSNLFSAGSGAWTFAPTLAVPLFDWGANQGKLKTAKAERDVAVAQYQKSVQTAFREVADALARRGTIAEQLAANESNVDASAQALRLTQALYSHGSDSYLDTLVAQRTLYSAQQTLISTRLALYTNLVTVYQTLGGGVQ
jgi:multidrug efflux system outer membrane protein